MLILNNKILNFRKNNTAVKEVFINFEIRFFSSDFYTFYNDFFLYGRIHELPCYQDLFKILVKQYFYIKSY
jgi:hypothetical protein